MFRSRCNGLFQLHQLLFLLAALFLQCIRQLLHVLIEVIQHVLDLIFQAINAVSDILQPVFLVSGQLFRSRCNGLFQLRQLLFLLLALSFGVCCTGARSFFQCIHRLRQLFQLIHESALCFAGLCVSRLRLFPVSVQIRIQLFCRFLHLRKFLQQLFLFFPAHFPEALCALRRARREHECAQKDQHHPSDQSRRTRQRSRSAHSRCHAENGRSQFIGQLHFSIPPSFSYSFQSLFRIRSFASFRYAVSRSTNLWFS